MIQIAANTTTALISIFLLTAGKNIRVSTLKLSYLKMLRYPDLLHQEV